MSVTRLGDASEIRKIKEAEADALAVALGFTPEPHASKPDAGPGPMSSVPPSVSPGDGDQPTPPTDPQRVIEKEEKRRRKEEKCARKAERGEVMKEDCMTEVVVTKTTNTPTTMNTAVNAISYPQNAVQVPVQLDLDPGRD
ncbi:MAG: hypothetical protein NXY57DRAFT_965125 [Lentinula lateritia]|nr:MAG: hypothetical protein NXY57DRAFT_965125 [Lentinula lateritia]